MKPTVAMVCLLLAASLPFAGASGGRGSECLDPRTYNFTVNVDRTVYPGAIKVSVQLIKWDDTTSQTCNQSSEKEFICKYVACGGPHGVSVRLIAADRGIHYFDAGQGLHTLYIGRDGARIDDNSLFIGLGLAALIGLCVLAWRLMKGKKKQAKKK